MKLHELRTRINQERTPDKYRNPLDILAEGYVLPDGYDSWGVKSIDFDGTTKYGFIWPAPGNETERYEMLDHNSSCPRQEGDGLCVGTTWSGMASGGFQAFCLLLVAYRSEEARGDETGKLRVPQVFVVARFNGEKLARESFRGADLSGAELSGANLRGADLYEANLRRANLRGADLYEANLRRANLRGADLSGADLSGANLRGADLSGADLSGANLRGADLYEANLRRANLRGADLYEANLRRANLRGADLYEANLRRANLRRANLRRAILPAEWSAAEVRKLGGYC